MSDTRPPVHVHDYGAATIPCSRPECEPDSGLRQAALAALAALAVPDSGPVIAAARVVAAEYGKLRVEAGSPRLDNACSELALAVSRLGR